MSNTKFIFIDENIKKSFEEVIDDSEFQRRLDDFEHNKNIVYKTLEELKEMEQWNTICHFIKKPGKSTYIGNLKIKKH